MGFLLVVFFTSTPAVSQSNITTQRYDNARTGQNLSETTLNTSNVKPGRFGKFFTRAVDDEVYAQPLYMGNVTVPKFGVRNVLYVASVNNSVYAFDADDPGSAIPLWHVNLTGAKQGTRPVNSRDVGQNCGSYRDYRGNIGIVGTPVIDEVTGTLYVVSRTSTEARLVDAISRSLDVVARSMRNVARAMETDDFAHRLEALIGAAHKPAIYVTTGILWHTSHAIEKLALTTSTRVFVQKLHALDITTGDERPNSPVTIEARVAGTGSGSWNGVLHFDPAIHNQRGSLLLAKNTVYVTWASHCETGPHHGWIMGYDPTTLRQVFAKTVTPDGKGGGIWQSNSGPSADDAGHVYLTTGNGTATAQSGGRDYGNAFLKLSPRGNVLDWFIPHNFEMLNLTDSDLGSAGVLVIPGTNLITSGGKQGKLYLLDWNNLGHFRPESDSQILQTLSFDGDFRGTPTYWNGPGGPYVYVWCSDCRGQAFRLERNLLSPAPISQTTMTSVRGGILSISANGTTPGTGILWANTGALRAFDATDLSHELWSSEQNPNRDGFGDFAKFNTPVVANGKVYLATFSNQVAVFGLLPDSNEPPVVDAGPDQWIRFPQKVTLVGTANDLVDTANDTESPTSSGGLRITWVQVSGPGGVTFSHPSELATTAAFSAPGSYALRLTASDGQLAADADVRVEVLP